MSELQLLGVSQPVGNYGIKVRTEFLGGLHSMQKLSLYVPVYSLTLLLSATLLFSVQPMFSKMILPLLGGTPQVWNTAMLFFQVMLLGGYAYAHGTTKYMSVRVQAITHIVLLSIFVSVLPIMIPPDTMPPVDRDPTLWQLTLMAMTVGGPFFVLGGSAPMLQRWFFSTHHPDAENPYFLYGASNLGSMTALLAYPTIIEPLLNLSGQAHAWEIGYIALIVLMAVSAWLAWPTGGAQTIAQDNSPDEHITWGRRALWLVLSFIPSSLMLGVTTFITTDIAAVPLLWILPLALYVATFIIVFARKPIIDRKFATMAQGFLLIALMMKMIAHYDAQNTGMIIILHLSLFFFSAMVCHTELALSRPSARRLTEFYLIMSLGGALGGVFNAIIAPVYFVIPLEYAMALPAVALMRYSATGEQNLKKTLAAFASLYSQRGLDILFTKQFLLSFPIIFATITAFSLNSIVMQYTAACVVGIGLLALIEKRWLFGILTAFILFLFPPGYEWGNFLFKDVLYRDRNFFGVMKVVDTKFGERILLHGTTNHGAQALDPKLHLTPLSYYSPKSPLNAAFSFKNLSRGNQEVAVVGLGIGVTACNSKPGRHFDFFEIDPEIAAIAQDKELFTFLSDCGSPYDIILGDGRLTIQKQPDHHYDIIFIDVFSSDNIPVHVLTKEAIATYMQKLKPDGVLIFNISNNYLDIEPVLTKISKDLKVPGYAHVTTGGTIEGTEIMYYAAHGFSMSNNQSYIKYLEKQGWTEGRERTGVKLWTDQFSNVFSVFENRIGGDRFHEAKAREKAADENKKK